MQTWLACLIAIGSNQTGLWENMGTWQGGSLPTLSDKVAINTGHTVTIPNGQTVQAGTLFNQGILQNFGTLQMGTLVGNATGTLQILDYKYHIRGGLKSINTDANNDLTNSLFSYKLDYEDDGTYFDGNIRKQSWKSNLDNVTRSYIYSYDGGSRIESGIYASTQTNENYSLNSVSYDGNGNILALSRNGFKSNNTFGLVDNLAYSYNTNSNKIQKVDDLSNETASFKDVNNSVDYSYWQDGNLKSDSNKGISEIQYNYLKLPKLVTFSDGKTISYQYNSMGRKMRETTSSGEVTDYVGNLIYKNNVLYQIGHDEGRIVNNIYEYDIKDHLGSLRVSFKDSSGVAKIVQSNSYGVWGDELPSLSYKNSSNFNIFKYNSKEFSSQTKLNDFGWRQQDPILGRFSSIDAMSEKWNMVSPYSCTVNSPIKYIDPDGRDIVNFKDRVKFTGDDAKILFQSLVEQSNTPLGINAIHFVYEALTPKIYEHTLNAFKQGKPEILHYDSDLKRQNKRRRESTGMYPTKPNQQRDEYPYASTFEGGLGALVTYVPSRENSIQGGTLGGIYSKLKDGDAFWVLPVPNGDPEKVTVPVSNGIMTKISEATGLTGAALLIYVIISESTRLFPPRNLVPIP